MSESPSTASLNLTAVRLKAQLDASRRPPQTHQVRRAVSSHFTPRKKGEQQREIPKTVAETRSSPPKGWNGHETLTSRLSASPAKGSSPRRTSTAHKTSPKKIAAPTPAPSRSNSTNYSVPGSASPAKASTESSPKRRTPSKLKLRDSLSPRTMSSTSTHARSSPSMHASGYADPVKTNDPRLISCASPPKRTPSKLKLKRSTPTADLASLGRSPSPKSPTRSSAVATADIEHGDAASSGIRRTRKD